MGKKVKKDSEEQSSYSGQSQQAGEKTLVRTEAKVNKIVKKDKKKPAKKKQPAKKKDTKKSSSSASSHPAKKKKPIKKKKQQEDKEEQNIEEVFLPGQKHPTPSSAEPTRIFYESCLKQLPNSVMAKTWLFQHGLFSYEEQKEIFEKNKAMKMKK